MINLKMLNQRKAIVIVEMESDTNETYAINGSRLTAFVSVFKSDTNCQLLRTTGSIRVNR